MTDEEKKAANRIACAKWREKNREYEKARSKQYYKDNQQKRLDSAKEHRESNREYYRMKNKENNPNRLRTHESVMFYGAKSRAKVKGFDFDIELSDVVIPDVCPILQQPLDLSKTNRDWSPSLDRIDNSKGYVKGNVQVISYKANRIKSTITLEEIELYRNYMFKESSRN